ncbi:MAG: helix-turn-helix transcriptional regulator [Gemmatimonadota bacterium]|nr:MAG: helix-turn-helix transcriptional regulator [Gemmatimonadota bacterium]
MDLRKRREQLGLTRSQLAALLGVSVPLVGAWERSEHIPTDEHIRRLAQILGVTSETLRREIAESRTAFVKAAATAVASQS